jgi:urease accessory protein
VNDYHERVTAGDAHGHFAIVLGASASRTNIDIREACLMQGYSFVSGLLGVSQRLLRLSHTDVQAILNDLKPIVITAWQESRDRDIKCIGSFVPSIELMSIKYERTERRLFKS